MKRILGVGDAHLKARTEVVLVTPALAEKWLEGNTRNRVPREKLVRLYAEEMVKGRWSFTGDPIQFGPNGELLNGQHRLLAIARAGVEIHMLVIWDVPLAAQANMDVGARRTAGDTLGMLGEENSINLAATVRLAIRVGRKATPGSAAMWTVSTAEILEWVEAHPEIRNIQKRALRYYKATDAPSLAVLAYCVWRMAAVDQYQAEQFLMDLADKVGLQRGDPVLALAKRFQAIRRSRTQVPVMNQVSMILRMWNARRKGERVEIVRDNIDGRPIPIPGVV